MSTPEIKKIIYLIRHGESADNVAPVFQSPDSPLSERGRLQAEAIAKRVMNLKFQALISSPWARAKETAQHIAKATNQQIEFSDQFVERMKPTSVNGKHKDDPTAAATWNEWRKSIYTPGMRIEDGENFDDLMARADKALQYLEARSEPSIVVVTHGVFLRAMILRILFDTEVTGNTLFKFMKATETENTGITVLQYRGETERSLKWHLWIYNDHAHLAE